MSTNMQATGRDMTTVRYVLVAALVALAFFLSYGYAAAKNGAGFDGASGVLEQGLTGLGGGSCCGGAAGGALAPGAPGTGGPADAPAPGAPAGGGCCGGVTSEPIEGFTTVEGEVQRVSVDATRGFDPNIIRAQAEIPIEITFSEGFGCMAEVMSRDLGFFEDLTTGSKTIALPALEPGEYGFSCGMEMVFGTIVVE